MNVDWIRGELENLTAIIDDMNRDCDNAETDEDPDLVQCVGDQLEDLIENASKLREYIRNL